MDLSDMSTSSLSYATPPFFDVQIYEDEDGDIIRRILYSENNSTGKKDYSGGNFSKKNNNNNRNIKIEDIKDETIFTEEDYKELCGQFSKLNGSMDPKRLNFTYPFGEPEPNEIMNY